MLRIRKHKTLDARTLNLRTGTRRLIVRGEVDEDGNYIDDSPDDVETEGEVGTPDAQTQKELAELQQLRNTPDAELTSEQRTHRDALEVMYSDAMSRVQPAAQDDEFTETGAADRVEEGAVNHEEGTAPPIEGMAERGVEDPEKEDDEDQKFNREHIQNMIFALENKRDTDGLSPEEENQLASYQDSFETPTGIDINNITVPEDVETYPDNEEIADAVPGAANIPMDEEGNVIIDVPDGVRYPRAYGLISDIANHSETPDEWSQIEARSNAILAQSIERAKETGVELGTDRFSADITGNMELSVKPPVFLAGEDPEEEPVAATAEERHKKIDGIFHRLPNIDSGDAEILSNKYLGYLQDWKRSKADVLSERLPRLQTWFVENLDMDAPEAAATRAEIEKALKELPDPNLAQKAYNSLKYDEMAGDLLRQGDPNPGDTIYEQVLKDARLQKYLGHSINLRNSANHLDRIQSDDRWPPIWKEAYDKKGRKVEVKESHPEAIVEAVNYIAQTKFPYKLKTELLDKLMSPRAFDGSGKSKIDQVMHRLTSNILSQEGLRADVTKTPQMVDKNRAFNAALQKGYDQLLLDLRQKNRATPGQVQTYLQSTSEGNQVFKEMLHQIAGGDIKHVKNQFAAQYQPEEVEFVRDNFTHGLAEMYAVLFGDTTNPNHNPRFPGISLNDTEVATKIHTQLYKLMHGNHKLGREPAHLKQLVGDGEMSFLVDRPSRAGGTGPQMETFKKNDINLIQDRPAFLGLIRSVKEENARRGRNYLPQAGSLESDAPFKEKSLQERQQEQRAKDQKKLMQERKKRNAVKINPFPIKRSFLGLDLKKKFAASLALGKSTLGLGKSAEGLEGAVDGLTTFMEALQAGDTVGNLRRHLDKGLKGREKDDRTRADLQKLYDSLTGNLITSDGFELSVSDDLRDEANLIWNDDSQSVTDKFTALDFLKRRYEGPQDADAIRAYKTNRDQGQAAKPYHGNLRPVTGWPKDKKEEKFVDINEAVRTKEVPRSEEEQAQAMQDTGIREVGRDPLPEEEELTLVESPDKGLSQGDQLKRDKERIQSGPTLEDEMAEDRRRRQEEMRESQQPPVRRVQPEGGVQPEEPEEPDGGIFNPTPPPDEGIFNEETPKRLSHEERLRLQEQEINEQLAREFPEDYASEGDDINKEAKYAADNDPFDDDEDPSPPEPFNEDPGGGAPWRAEVRREEETMSAPGGADTGPFDEEGESLDLSKPSASDPQVTDALDKLPMGDSPGGQWIKIPVEMVPQVEHVAETKNQEGPDKDYAIVRAEDPMNRQYIMDKLDKFLSREQRAEGETSKEEEIPEIIPAQSQEERYDEIRNMFGGDPEDTSWAATSGTPELTPVSFPEPSEFSASPGPFEPLPKKDVPEGGLTGPNSELADAIYDLGNRHMNDDVLYGLIEKLKETESPTEVSEILKPYDLNSQYQPAMISRVYNILRQLKDNPHEETVSEPEPVPDPGTVPIASPKFDTSLEGEIPESFKRERKDRNIQTERHLRERRDEEGSLFRGNEDDDLLWWQREEKRQREAPTEYVRNSEGFLEPKEPRKQGDLSLRISR